MNEFSKKKKKKNHAPTLHHGVLAEKEFGVVPLLTNLLDDRVPVVLHANHVEEGVFFTGIADLLDQARLGLLADLFHLAQGNLRRRRKKERECCCLIGQCGSLSSY